MLTGPFLDAGKDGDSGTLTSPAHPDGGVQDALDAGSAAETSLSPDAGTWLAPASTTLLHGRVVGKGTRDPIEGASVAVDRRPVAETRPDGFFDAIVTPGKHRLHVQCPGFAPQDLAVDLPLSEPLRILLQPADHGAPPAQTQLVKFSRITVCRQVKMP